VSESKSEEGKAFQSQHSEINFNICQLRCSGYMSYGTCEFYVPKNLSELEVETMEDSSLAGLFEMADSIGEFGY